MLRACTTLLYALTAEAVRSNLKAERANAIGQVMETVSSLLQRGNADDEVLSHLRALAGHSDEPGGDATDALNSALVSVISELDTNVLAKIQVAHTQTQAAIDQTIGDMKAATMTAVNQKNTADDNDNTWFQCIEDEKKARVAIENAEVALQQAEDAQVQPCLNQENAKMVNLDLSMAPFKCDISEGKCDVKLDDYESKDVSQLLGEVQSGIFSKRFSYNAAKSVCDAAKADVLAKQTALTGASGLVDNWKSQQALCLQKHSPRKLSMCLFGTDLQNKCEKVTAHTAQMDLVNGAGNEFSHSDRVAEWGTTAKTKCLLQKIIDGETLGADASLECDTEAIYEDVLNKYDDVFAEYTSGSMFTCSETSISFRGETWDLPQLEEAKSTDYVVVPYNPVVDLNAGEPPFAVCAPTPTCEGDAKGAPCSFPFTYAGVTFNACTKQDSYRPWCATSPMFPGPYGFCDC